mgnify:CR=1 FL=1
MTDTNTTSTIEESETMIEFDSVTKIYPDQTVAIEDISFEVERGTTTVFVGPSGCGKTTTMTLVNRMQDPTEGTVYYDGTDVQDYDKVDLRRDIGYVIQEIGLFDHMTVGENIATVPELKGWDQDRIDERVDELLELMSLPPETYRDQHPAALSGGQQQRVGVARALAADPNVILMDEPFGALDPITREELQDEFLDIQERIDTTILFVTHDINEALKMGDKIAIFDVGELVQYGTPTEIIREPANNFVEEFIGADRTLKELQITSVRDVMQNCAAAKDSLEGSISDMTAGVKTDDGELVLADGTGEQYVTPTDSVDIALSRMIQIDATSVPVVDDGELVGIISESDIRAYQSAGGDC